MSKAKLIAAMHASCGAQIKATTDWLTAAQSFDELRKAFNTVYGKKLPTRQKLGQDLSAWAGTEYGERRLVSIFDTHRKGYRYAVETAAETAARERKKDEQEERQEIIDAEKEQRAIARALKKAAEREAKEREAAELVAVASLNIEVLPEALHPAHVPPSAPEPRLKCGPDGRPVPDPELPPPVARSESWPPPGWKLLETRHKPNGKTEHWQKPDGSIVENFVPFAPAIGWQPAGINGRPTRAQLAARHHQYEQPANIPRPVGGPGLPLTGLSGPGGIRQDARGAESWTNRLCLKDF